MHYLDPQQMDRAYGPDPTQARRAQRWLQAQGLQADCQTLKNAYWPGDPEL